MKRLTCLSCALLVGLASMIVAPASRAGVDIGFGVNAPVGDGDLFFSISSRYFDLHPRMVHGWGSRFHHPDDLAVFLHVCAHSRLSPEAVYSYRRQGLSWYDVGARAGVPVEVWYAPGYAHWKKHGQYRHRHMRLSDRQVRDRVAVRMAHEYYGVAPEVAMDWRRGGSNVRVIMTREYRTRHHRDHRHDDRHDHRHDSHHDSDHDSNNGGHRGGRHHRD